MLEYTICSKSVMIEDIFRTIENNRHLNRSMFNKSC